ncbi:hypothetical protein KP509_16G009100 [Ceratopteris richardii]|uniref:Uncharacterized protein n=1 Tax=Ceratopteris richardii TaxID=49495 RepID=A0A8T2SY18_CERRI|nr:hypothetical protein KP509_16G009100 [Ceratopteris richardii]
MQMIKPVKVPRVDKEKLSPISTSTKVPLFVVEVRAESGAFSAERPPSSQSKQQNNHEHSECIRKNGGVEANKVNKDREIEAKKLHLCPSPPTCQTSPCASRECEVIDSSPSLRERER